jgi:ribosomal protein S18 acetylase RimI-like enzyme
MITIRRMTANDLTLGMRLSAQAGWNQTEADWRRFLKLEPKGCFAAIWGQEPVATTAAFVFGTVGWIAMVLVDEAFRHRGIASRLVEHALTFLDERGVRTTRLDATPLGRPVYERLGFRPEYSLVRMQGVMGPSADGSGFASLSSDQMRAIGDLDQHLTSTPRHRLLRALYDERPTATAAEVTPGGVAGYAMWRPGRRAAQIGPAMALSPQAGTALLDRIRQQGPAGPVFADVPEDNAAAVAWFTSQAFTVQRGFTRMYRGERMEDFPERIWASSGPEKG